MCPWLTKYTPERGRQWTLFCHQFSYHLCSVNFGRIKFSNLSATVGFKHVFVSEGYLEPSRTSTMEFFLRK